MAAHSDGYSNQGAAREPLSYHLPRNERVYLQAARACLTCGGGGVRRLGENLTSQLEFVPASIRGI